MLVLLACTSPADDSAGPLDLIPSLVEPGPYKVGYRQVSVTYSDDISTDRTLRLALWFPTEETGGGSAAYLDGAIDAPDVLDDPTPLAGTLPLVIFSHGHQGFAENSSFLCEHLASHGYAVAAPDHTNDTSFDTSSRATEIYIQRPRDLTAVLDQVSDHLDVAVDSVPAVGHSFGGYSVFALGGATWDASVIDACTPETTEFCSSMTPALAAAFAGGARDDRVTTIIPMASGDYELFGPDGLGGLVPTLQMSGELDVGDQPSYWAALEAEHHRLEVLGAGHQAFTDFSGVLEDGGTIDPETGFQIIRAYTLAAIRRSEGDTSVAPLFDGTASVSDEAYILP